MVKAEEGAEVGGGETQPNPPFLVHEVVGDATGLPLNTWINAMTLVCFKEDFRFRSESL